MLVQDQSARAAGGRACRALRRGRGRGGARGWRTPRRIGPDRRPLDRDPPEDRALRRLGIDCDHLVARGGKSQRDFAFAAADLEHPARRRRELRQYEVDELRHRGRGYAGRGAEDRRSGAASRRVGDRRPGHRSPPRLPAARSDLRRRAAATSRTLEPARVDRPVGARPPAVGGAKAVRVEGRSSGRSRIFR